MGALAVTGAGPRAARVGLLPPWWLLAACVLGAMALAIGARLSTQRSLPLFLAGVVVLPWLPAPLPDVVLVWAGPAGWFVLAAAIIGVAAGSTHTQTAWRAGNRGLAPFLAAVIVFAAAGWRVAPMLPGGDEPHYLIIAQSLLRDGDLQIENNHRQRDYRTYFSGDLRPDYLRRGTNGQIYSIHAPGLAVLVLPAFALGGYPAVKIFLILIAAAATTLAWRAARSVTGSPGAAWFAWAAVALTTPFLFLAFTVYPDGVGAALVMTAVAALVTLDSPVAAGAAAPGGGAARARPLWWWAGLGAACAALPWLHPRYAVLAASLGLAVLARIAGRGRSLAAAVAFLAAPVGSAVAWFGYFYLLYGSVNPSSAYGHYTQMAAAQIARGLTGLLFDQQFGLIANAPVYALAIAGFVPLARRRPRLAAELALVIVPYTLVTASYQMWWGGHSSPARFLGPILLALALPIAAAWTATRTRATRTLNLLLLAGSVALAAVFVVVDRGRLAYNVRDGFALWLLWASPIVSAARGLPSLFRNQLPVAFAEIAIWLALPAGAWLASRTLERRARLSNGVVALLVPAALAIAVSLSMAWSWHVEGSPGLAPAPAQLQLLRAAAAGRHPVAVAYDPFRFETPSRVPGLLRLAATGVPAGTLLWFPNVPAGHYRLRLDNRERDAAVDIGVSIGRTDSPVTTWALRHLAAGRAAIDLDLPVEVHSIAVRGQIVPPQALRALWLEPVDVRRGTPVNGFTRATAARRYGDAVVYGLGDDVYLEPSGLWVGAESGAGLFIVSDAPGAEQRLLLRAGPVATRVTLTSGTWAEELDLAPGGTREVLVPRQPDGHATPLAVRAGTGFRPADSNARSTDTRYLGVWVEPGQPAVQNRATPPK